MKYQNGHQLVLLPLPQQGPEKVKATTTNMAGGNSASHAALFMAVVAPVAIAFFLYRADDYDPAPFPASSLVWATRRISLRNDGLAAGSEKLGEGLLPGPEDLAYDPEEGYLYTGCSDGWIRRVKIGDGVEKAVVVEKWVDVGGRPLGLAFSPDGELVVAEADKGLLKVSKDRTVQMLASEAEGVPFRLTDGVDVSRDGVVYFTDASYKYNMHHHVLDVFEGKPYGRLLSFDPALNRTTVLARDLYFANGVAISPTQDFLVFCETPLRRCRKYYIQGDKKGTMDNFIDDLEGFPDNIRYDGNGHYWIGLSSKRTTLIHFILKYPVFRKVMAILTKYGKVPAVESNGGVMSVDLEAKSFSVYLDPSLALVTGGIKVGEYLYYGSLKRDYIGRLDLKKYPAKMIQ